MKLSQQEYIRRAETLSVQARTAGSNAASPIRTNLMLEAVLNAVLATMAPDETVVAAEERLNARAQDDAWHEVHQTNFEA